MEEMVEWYKLSKEEILKKLKTSEKGLPKYEVFNRLKKYGKNVIESEKRLSALKIFLEQFNSPLIWLLLVASIISLVVGGKEGILEAGLIFIILILNAFLGFIQEYRAEHALESLKKLVPFNVKVIREGKKEEIPAEELVPGDIVIIEEGMKVPADIRILEANDIYVNESLLTGESTPVYKTEEPLNIENPTIQDLRNMLFMGTYVVRGSGIGVVVATGKHTEMGKIAEKISEEDTKKTPLEIQLSKLGKILTILILLIILVIFSIRLLQSFPNIRYEHVVEILLISISLAIAAVPEGLPAVITISLSLAAKRFAEKNALIRKLAAAQTLGSVDTICTDKTGTLTLNQMTVRKIWYSRRIYEVTGEGYEPRGSVLYKGRKIIPDELNLVGKICLYCNDAELIEENGEYKILGDPTEGALIVLAYKLGIKEKPKIVKKFEFDRTRKRMSVIVKEGSKLFVYVKGAPDMLLEKCNKIILDGRITPITDHIKEEILKNIEKFADKAYRVLGLAYREISPEEEFDVEKIENNLVFVGLIAMEDPIRPEVFEAVKIAKKAGIDIYILTGDHPKTAKAIASRLGITGEVLTGRDLDLLTDRELLEKLKTVRIFARITPEHKYRIVTLLKSQGRIVAMTGDGVNDAPALKKADIGIAMGKRGTDVAREAADMILLDDNFETIVKAIWEGRRILINIREFVFYLLSSNIGEVVAVALPSFMFLPNPLTATQLLWLNLVTDGLPATALSEDSAPKDVINKDPRSMRKVITRNMLIMIVIRGIVDGLIATYLFSKYLSVSLVYASSVVLTFLVLTQMARIIVTRILFNIPQFENKFLIAAVISSILLQFMILYIENLSKIFGVVPLSIWALLDIVAFVLLSGSIMVGISKVVKWAIESD